MRTTWEENVDRRHDMTEWNTVFFDHGLGEAARRAFGLAVLAQPRQIVKQGVYEGQTKTAGRPLLKPLEVDL